MKTTTFGGMSVMAIAAAIAFAGCECHVGETPGAAAPPPTAAPAAPPPTVTAAPAPTPTHSAAPPPAPMPKAPPPR
jgi:hypothetical protein